MHILDYVFFWPLLILEHWPWFRSRPLEDRFTIGFVISVAVYTAIVVGICFAID